MLPRRQAIVDSVAGHACCYVLFSAVPPGQGGLFHVNEQPYDFWRSALSDNGFVAIDAVRPAIGGDGRISYWYRYNTFLYVRREAVRELPASLLDSVVPDDMPLADVSPLAFRARKAVVRRLSMQNEIARLKAKIFPTGRI